MAVAGYEYVSALLRGMTRVDGMFHMAVGATLLFGLAIAGGVAEKIWEKQNEGVGGSQSQLSSLAVATNF